MADVSKEVTPRDDAAIFSISSSSSVDDDNLDTEDPTGGRIRHGNIRPHATPNRSIKSGSFPDGKLYNLTRGAKKIP